ncbi:TFIIH basal transcription factor complex helicase XPB subunit [Cichlidogyrus casuarinus]|uniref:TFIIH basal transcription factor complex helicase XPB subunit n=1 Tax=Cichlidogyrus casuarinus TaxID=1844966 RepID=A0ABD2QHC3_9PLAT
MTGRKGAIKRSGAGLSSAAKKSSLDAEEREYSETYDPNSDTDSSLDAASNASNEDGYDYESAGDEARIARMSKKTRKQNAYHTTLNSSNVMFIHTQEGESEEAAGNDGVARDEFGAKDLRNLLKLREDHNIRPLWIGPDGHVFLETFSPISRQAEDFLIAISEPVCRPEHIHEYKLTSYSLYAAVSVGLKTEEIIGCLRRLCKTDLPKGIIEYVRCCTLSYGKAKLVLRSGRYFVESKYKGFLQKLAKDPIVSKCLIRQISDIVDADALIAMEEAAAEGKEAESVEFTAKQSASATEKNDHILGLANKMRIDPQVLHLYAQMDAIEEAAEADELEEQQQELATQEAKKGHHKVAISAGESDNIDLNALGMENAETITKAEIGAALISVMSFRNFDIADVYAFMCGGEAQLMPSLMIVAKPGEQ